MKKCYKCGMDGIADNCRFCPNCGTRLDADRVCPACGSVVQGSSNFCPMCGTNLTNAQPAGFGAAPVPAAAPGPYAAPAWNVPAAVTATQKPVVSDKSGTAWIIKFLPALLLLIFCVATFIAIMAGTGYSITEADFYESYTYKATFFYTLSNPDLMCEFMGYEDNPGQIIGIILVAVAVLSLIIGLAGFGKAARKGAGEAWTKNCNTTFVWGIIMYVLAILVSVVYCMTMSGRLEEDAADWGITMGLGSTPVTIIVFAVIGIVGSIVIGVLKGMVAKKYGTLDNLQTAPEKKKAVSRGVRTGYSWTILGRSLLFFVFAILLLLFFRMNLFSDDLGMEESTSLYTLLADEYDMYGVQAAMLWIFVAAALCVFFGFIFLMIDLAKRKKIANATVPDKGTAQRSMFMIFLFCLMLAVIGYAYGKLDGQGYLVEEAAMAEYGYHIMGSLMSSIVAITIIFLIIHILAILAQYVLFNIFDFSGTASGLPANGGPAMTPAYAAPQPPVQPMQYRAPVQSPAAQAPVPQAQPAAAPQAQPVQAAQSAQPAPAAAKNIPDGLVAPPQDASDPDIKPLPPYMG